MTNPEFSDNFDVLYNNITSNQAPGLNDYEKSVFLTKAQNEIVLSYFDPLKNKPQEGFDGSEKRQIDFSMLMQTSKGTKIEDTKYIKLSFADNTGLFLLPNNVLLIVNEYVVVTRDNKTKNLIVTPITYKDYNNLMLKPYKRPLRNQAWRLNTGVKNQSIVEIIPGVKDAITQYTIRYVKRPRAIILSELEGVTLDGVTSSQTCELDPILHEEILQRAVELAKIAYQGDTATILQGGNVSSTDKGYIQQARQ